MEPKTFDKPQSNDDLTRFSIFRASLILYAVLEAIVIGSLVYLYFA